jgi:hypothetical protein
VSNRLVTHRLARIESSVLTIFFGLVHSRDFIGKSPKQERSDDTSPHLRHDIEQGKTPVSDNGQGSGKSGWQACREKVDQGMRVKSCSRRVNHSGKQGKEGQERNDASVKDILVIHAVAHFGIQSSKALVDVRKR